MLERLIGHRYETLNELKNDIENLTGKKVECIEHGECDRIEDMDFVIGYYFNDEDVDVVHSIYYLKDNGGNYYITEV